MKLLGILALVNDFHELHSSPLFFLSSKSFYVFNWLIIIKFIEYIMIKPSYSFLKINFSRFYTEPVAKSSDIQKCSMKISTAWVEQDGRATMTHCRCVAANHNEPYKIEKPTRKRSKQDRTQHL